MENYCVNRVKYELNQTLVMINLCVKFNGHSSNEKQVMVLNVVER